MRVAVLRCCGVAVPIRLVLVHVGGGLLTVVAMPLHGSAMTIAGLTVAVEPSTGRVLTLGGSLALELCQQLAA